MSRKIFVFHNAKAAGTSLIEAIIGISENATLCPHIAHTVTAHASLGGRYSAFSGYDLYAGHYGRDVFEAVSDGHQTLTNFRHPVSRILSLYNYFRFTVQLPDVLSEAEKRDHTCVLAAKSLSFDEFVASENPCIRTYTSDFHFRQLGKTPWEFPLDDLKLNDLCDFIDHMAAIYICEYREASVARLTKEFSILNIGDKNTTEGHDLALKISDVRDSTKTKVLEMNQRDCRIYDYAVTRLLRG